jgi:hypothetical protein
LLGLDYGFGNRFEIGSLTDEQDCMASNSTTYLPPGLSISGQSQAAAGAPREIDNTVAAADSGACFMRLASCSMMLPQGLTR